MIFESGELDASSPGINCRSRRFVAVHIGMRVIDVLFPVAQGQRELVIGDRQTGKTSILSGASLAYVLRNFAVGARKMILAFFANIGQRISTGVRLFAFMQANFLDSTSTILIAGVTSAMSAQFLGPLACTTLSEIYRNIGLHNYVGYDDLSKHAVAYRQLCLFLGKPAGREAFPSDIFFLHARILERSCCLSGFLSLGSLMCLPIIETLSNDLSAYIATNVVSITDGQLYLDVGLFGLSQCPAISTEKSVSRVGAKSLDNLFRQLSFRIYTLIADYKQEVDLAVKSEAFKMREHRFARLSAMFVQRSTNDR